MPSLADVVICALAMLVVCGCIGAPLARWLIEERGWAWALAPALGWAVFSTLALPILTATGFSRGTATIVCVAAVVVGIAALRRESATPDNSVGVPLWLFAAVAIVAILPALGVWPKFADGGLVLADPMFDHSKIAIIDDIVRAGLPPGNPFYGGADAPPQLVYYYLWHFSAAVFAALTGTSGWEADIALTWFTAFASLALMMGFAVRLSERRLAAPLVLVLCLAASLGPTLRTIFTADLLERGLSPVQAPYAWIFQATWTPQHLAAAGSVVLAVLILARLRRPLVPLLGIVVASGFESSVWVGGVVFGTAAVPIGVARLIRESEGRKRLNFALQAGAAALIALALAYPFLQDDLVAAASRHLGLPIAFLPYRVLGPLVPDAVSRLLDLPAYWLILLPMALPAIYFAGFGGMLGALAGRRTTPAERQLVVAFSLLAGTSFGIAWLFASTIANNDLGWRGVLPGILVFTIFAASGLSRWLATAPKRALAALICLALGLPGGFAIIADNAVGRRLPSAAALAETPEMWAEVRRHTGPDERIANNPLFFFDSVQWPVNISWALFADRRSCFAGWNLARAFVPLPEAELDRLERLFDRVFAGDGSREEVDEVATRYGCQVIVLTARDGAWERDPFAGNPRFRLVEERAGAWRIYRVVGTSPGISPGGG
jgi:hypothetical protein